MELAPHKLGAGEVSVIDGASNVIVTNIPIGPPFYGVTSEAAVR